MPSVRPATPADLQALHELVERGYRGDSARGGWTHEADLVEGPRLESDELAAALADPTARLLVAIDGPTTVGCVRVQRMAENRATLGLLTVNPVRQARGLGSRLLAAGEEAGRELGASVIEMTVIDGRHELIAWYERRGYRATGERRPFPVVTERPLEFLVLAKSL